MDERIKELVRRHIPLSNPIGYAMQEIELNRTLYASTHQLLEKCSGRTHSEPEETATEISRTQREKAMWEGVRFLGEETPFFAKECKWLGEPAIENILKDIGGIRMSNREFVVLDNIDKVIIRTRDGREFEGCAIRSEYMPGPFGAAGYSDLTVRTLKQTSSGNYGIKEVIFDNPATIVKWDDGTQTVVCCQDNVEYVEKTVDGKKVKVRKPKKAKTFNPEMGLAMAIAKKHFGNLGTYNKIFHKYIPETQEKPEAKEIEVK